MNYNIYDGDPRGSKNTYDQWGGPLGGFIGSGGGGSTPEDGGGGAAPAFSARRFASPYARRRRLSMGFGGDEGVPLQLSGMPAMSSTGSVPASYQPAAAPGMAYSGAPGAPTGGGGGGGGMWASLRNAQSAARGGARGGGYDPNDPFLGPGGAFNPKQGMDALIDQAYQSGAYGGGKESRVLADLMKFLELRGQTDIGQAGLAAKLYAGDDPATGNYARIRAEQGVRDRNAMTMAEARAKYGMDQEDFLRELLGMYSGAIFRKDPKNPSPWAQIGGSVLGAAVGAL